MPGISRERFIKASDVKPGKFARKFWTWGDEVYWHKYLIPYADAKSFECYNDHWACDKKHVYHMASRVRGADVKSFKILNRIFCKDRNHVYCEDGIAKRCDPATFEVLDKGTARFCEASCGYAKDNQNVYFHDSGEGNAKLIRGANRDTFRVIRGGFATDGKRVYVFGRRIQKVDVETFKPLGGLYSQDAKQIFYLEFEMDKRVDRESFKTIGKDKAADKNRTYTMYYANQ